MRVTVNYRNKANKDLILYLHLLVIVFFTGARYQPQEYTFGTVELRHTPPTPLTLVGEYKMDRQPYHGRAWIINNLASDQKTSAGAQNDVKNVTTLFKYLGYEVKEEVGLDKDGMMALFDKIAEFDHTRYDSFVCCILSHGEEHGQLFYGSPKEPVVIGDLVGCLNASVCTSLKGKPKMFFINACRGSKTQRPVALERIPDTADFLFCYATSSGYTAYEPDTGSCYIKEVCKIITENAVTRASLSDMMTKVNEVVASTVQSGNAIQAPEITSRLRKHVTFFQNVN